MMDAVFAEKDKFTPETGYNVVGHDTFEVPGECLFLVGHYETEAEANKVRDAHIAASGSSGQRYYVYAAANLANPR